MMSVISPGSKQLYRLFAALGEPTRYKIILILARTPDICVSSIAAELGLSVSAVSQHCKLLELSGILARDRRGQQTCYQLRKDDPSVASVLKLIAKEAL